MQPRDDSKHSPFSNLEKISFIFAPAASDASFPENASATVTATYRKTKVGTAKQITVAYALTGTNADSFR